MLRLAKNFGERFWFLDTMQQANFLIDSCLNNSVRKIEQNKILSMRHSKIGKQVKISIKSQKLFDLGQVVTIEGNAVEFVIVGLKIRLEHESYFFYYELEELKIAPKKISDTPILAKSFKFHAKIKNVKDPKNLGRVQVTFDDKFVEDMDEKNPLWIPYRTPYSGKNGGIVFIPDEGDAVEVFLQMKKLFASLQFVKILSLQNVKKFWKNTLATILSRKFFGKKNRSNFFQTSIKLL